MSDFAITWLTATAVPSSSRPLLPGCTGMAANLTLTSESPASLSPKGKSDALNLYVVSSSIVTSLLPLAGRSFTSLTTMTIV